MPENSPEICVVVGLGNPSDEYSGTRHNAGFMIADAFLGTFPGKSLKKLRAAKAEAFGVRFSGRTIYVLKPTTFMNLSGEAVAPFLRTIQADASQVAVVYDDLDIPVGRIRLGKGGGSAGHKGVDSIIGSLDSRDFVRLRAGIGAGDARRGRDYVLSGFEEEELRLFGIAVENSVSALRLLVARGLDAAMNEFNGKSPESAGNGKCKEN